MTAACDESGPTGIQFNELERAERRWQTHGPPNGRYTMLQQRICFCADYMITYELTVAAGAPTRVRTPTGLEVPQAMWASFRSVEQLFLELRSGLATGAVKEVAYDAASGYPAVVSLDPLRDAADDEVVFRNSNVTFKP
ncbi:MAG: hypothetical protein H7Z40_09985 [Phycisphaerae bacterium]|nr:hypothetical protein [Gemmatimonadaceae bacterium]